MRRLLTKFVDDESGATAIEYALIAAGISIVIRGIDQILDRDLPALALLGVFRQLHDVIGGVLQCCELAAGA